MKSKTKKFVLVMVALVTISSCKQENTFRPVNSVPVPLSIEERGGYFEITLSLEIYTPDDSGTGKIVKYFQDQFALVSGIKLKFEEIEDRRNDQGIIIELLPEADLLGDEGYLLNVKNRKIELSAHQPAELFREVQTLFPIIPLNLQENNYWPE